VRPFPIEAARARHTLIDVARRAGVDLYRTSGSTMVRCPFPSHGHFDRSPSLRLYIDDGFWHCFGCGRKGDVVEWVCQTEGVGWRQAIRILDSGCALNRVWTTSESSARRSDGFSGRRAPAASMCPFEPPSQVDDPDLSRTPATRVFEALASAWAHFSSGPLHERGAAYLARRGIDVAVLEAHTGRDEVGHTPASPDGLVTAMRVEGFASDELVDAGLAHRSAQGRVTDFYRQRVLIPIRDQQERLCGFVGRNIGDDRWPKYKNPPRTATFDKSVNLYQPLPSPTAGSRGQVVVVEGTLDAMAIAVAAVRSGTAGRFCPLTQSGRELSAFQLDHVLRLHPFPPVIAFDGDVAGRESALRHAMAAARQGHAVLVTTLPGDHDPASWLAEKGAEGLGAWAVAGALDRSRPLPKPIPGGTYIATRPLVAETISDPPVRNTSNRPTL
jgi:DNA primase